MEQDVENADGGVSRDDVEAMRLAIETREDLADFIGVLIDHMRDDKPTWEKTIMTLMMDLTDTIAEGRLSELVGGGTLPDTPTWKTFGDIIYDAVYRQ